MMSPKRLEAIKKLANEKGTIFATESSLVSNALRHALRDAVAEIEDLQERLDEIGQDAQEREERQS